MLLNFSSFWQEQTLSTDWEKNRDYTFNLELTRNSNLLLVYWLNSIPTYFVFLLKLEVKKFMSVSCKTGQTQLWEDRWVGDYPLSYPRIYSFPCNYLAFIWLLVSWKSEYEFWWRWNREIFRSIVKIARRFLQLYVKMKSIHWIYFEVGTFRLFSDILDCSLGRKNIIIIMVLQDPRDEKSNA